MRTRTLTPQASVDERCVCGKLVARIVPEGVEIRCRGCKRTHLIPWPKAPEMMARGM